MSDELKEMLIFIVIVVIVIVAVSWGVTALDGKQLRIRSAKCDRTSEISGFPTKYENTCWMQIKPDLWIPTNDILKYLPFLLEEE